MKIKFTDESENFDYHCINTLEQLEIFSADSECREIFIDGYLEKLCSNTEEQKTFISIIVNKLRLKGLLLITFYDVDLLNHRYNRGDISINEINQIVSETKSFTSQELILEYLRVHSLEISHITVLENGMTKIIAERVN